VTASLSGLRCRSPSSGLPGNSASSLERSLSDLAPDEVYPASPITRAPGGLLHHRFTLTADPEVGGGLLSVALSRGLLRVGVTHRPALWSPEFLGTRPKPSDATSGRPVCVLKRSGCCGTMHPGGTLMIRMPFTIALVTASCNSLLAGCTANASRPDDAKAPPSATPKGRSSICCPSPWLGSGDGDFGRAARSAVH